MSNGFLNIIYLSLGSHQNDNIRRMQVMCHLCSQLFSKCVSLPQLCGKGKVFANFYNFKILVEKKIDQKTRCLQSYAGTQDLLDEFTTQLKLLRVCQQFVSQYRLQQNKVAQCKNRHIRELVACTIINKKKSQIHIRQK